LQATGEAAAPDLLQLWTGTWDPHDPHRFCTAGGNNIQASDSLTVNVVAGVEMKLIREHLFSDYKDI
jgi:hypothetical protein